MLPFEKVGRSWVFLKQNSISFHFVCLTKGLKCACTNQVAWWVTHIFLAGSFMKFLSFSVAQLCLHFANMLLWNSDHQFESHFSSPVPCPLLPFSLPTDMSAAVTEWGNPTVVWSQYSALEMKKNMILVQ